MSIRGYISLGMLGLAAVVGAVGAINRKANYDAADGTIISIDRSCKFTETYTDGTKKLGVEDSCYATGEFEAMRDDKKRRQDIDGKATYRISYVAPKDKQVHYSELKFTGRDDEFYKLALNDHIKVLVAKDNPDRIIQD